MADELIMGILSDQMASSFLRVVTSTVTFPETSDVAPPAWEDDDPLVRITSGNW